MKYTINNYTQFETKLKAIIEKGLCHIHRTKKIKHYSALQIGQILNGMTLGIKSEDKINLREKILSLLHPYIIRELKDGTFFIYLQKLREQIDPDEDCDDDNFRNTQSRNRRIEAGINNNINTAVEKISYDIQKIVESQNNINRIKLKKLGNQINALVSELWNQKEDLMGDIISLKETTDVTNELGRDIDDPNDWVKSLPSYGIYCKEKNGYDIKKKEYDRLRNKINDFFIDDAEVKNIVEEMMKWYITSSGESAEKNLLEKYFDFIRYPQIENYIHLYESSGYQIILDSKGDLFKTLSQELKRKLPIENNAGMKDLFFEIND